MYKSVGAEGERIEEKVVLHVCAVLVGNVLFIIQ